ncbi:MAG: M13 family metallopeptidase [Pseudomonadota bacterium]|nr:M13 family metallopeptidase [Pseudomonadota bacterium]
MRRSILAASLAVTTAIAGIAYAQTKPAAAPTYGTFGFDESGMDRSVAPGDDFYAFANGTWARNTPIPADKSNYGAFTILSDLSEKRTKGILETAATDPKSKIGVAYATFLDRPAIDAKGMTPIRPLMAKIKGMTKGNYAALIAETQVGGIGGPFSAYVGQDAKNSEIYALELRQSGLGMPDRDYYLSADAKLSETKAAYQNHLSKVLTLAGEPNADARAKAILDFETAIARVSWTKIDSRDADKTYNKMTVAELQKSAPGFDFATYFKGIGTPVDTVVVAQPTAVAAIAKLVGDAPIGVLQDQLMVRSLDTYADVLPKAFDDEQFAFYGKALSGTEEQEARWKRGVQFTVTALDDEVSKIYVQKYFPPATKAAADMMVKNIIAAMGERIDKLTWMSPETKVKAHEKLAAFSPKIGYPSRWRDYAALTITRGDAFGNEWRSNEWQHHYNVGHLGKPLQRWEWHMPPSQVNAYANFGMVEIVFPAAILQPPFFDPNADPAVNYGGIGAVIGHEMSHHFDDQGAKYDKNGKLTQWWTPADIAAFKKLSAALVAEYDAYEPLPGVHVQGALTLGENSADLAGLSVAYDAYHKTLGGKPAPVIGGYTGDQRFYLGWAQVWRRNFREAALRQRILTDPHSPSPQRADIVRNMDHWYDAFGAKPGQKLYLTPDRRVRIW